LVAEVVCEVLDVSPSRFYSWLSRPRSRDEARADVFNYIERFYNPRL
jgi:hypothetical protein